MVRYPRGVFHPFLRLRAIRCRVALVTLFVLVGCIATLCYDVCDYNYHRMAMLTSVHLQHQEIWSLDFLRPEHRFLVVSGSMATIVDSKSGEIRLLVESGAVKETVAVSTDHNTIAFATSDSVHLWDSKAIVELMRIPIERAVTAVAISNDSRIVAAADTAGSIGMWSTRTGHLIGTYPWHDNDISEMHFCGNDTGIITFQKVSGELVIRHLTGDNDGTDLRRAGEETGRYIASISQNGAMCVVSRVLSNSFTIHRLFEEGEAVVVRSDGGAIEGITCSDDGKRVATLHKGSYVKIWDTATAAQLCSSRMNVGALAMAFSKDSRRLAIGGTSGAAPLMGRVPLIGRFIRPRSAVGAVAVLDVATATIRGLGTSEAPIGSVRFSEDGSELVTGAFDGAVSTWRP